MHQGWQDTARADPPSAPPGSLVTTRRKRKTPVRPGARLENSRLDSFIDRNKGGVRANTDVARHYHAARRSDGLRRRRADHEKPYTRTRREARDCRRAQGPGPAARYARVAPARSGRFAGVLGACELRARSARRPPLRQRLARAAVSDRCEQSAAPLCRRRRDISAFGLSPPLERLHRFRVSPRIRDQRPVVHGARRVRTGKSENARLHAGRLRTEGRDLPQRHHRMARDQPGRQHVRGDAARAPARRPTSSRT